MEVTRFGPGEFFGEISLLTGEPPVADIVALTMLRCLVIPGPEFERFMLENPRILYRMLQAEARRLRNTTEWKSGS
jgi:CRP-like cAMP-binding protein